MRRLAITIGLACLGGCALSPAELRDQGELITFQRPTRPIETATCVARAIEEYNPAIGARFPSELRPTPKSDTYEVRSITGGDTMLLAEITPNGTGSSVALWKSPNLVFPIAEAVQKSC